MQKRYFSYFFQLLSGSLATDIASKLSDASPDESFVSSSIITQSLTAEETKASISDQLMTMIKYMREEKVIAIAKLEISNRENDRLNTEAELLKKKLSEAITNNINSKRPAAEINVVSALKYEEIMRQVETFNSITDSNRGLRKERDALTAQVASLTKRDRCTNFVDPSQKNSVESENENLATNYTAEREAFREEKARLDNDLSTVSNHCQAHMLEKKKLSEELIALKAVSQHTAEEIMELKSALIQKENEIKKITDDLATVEATVTNSKDKEPHVRKITKRYKDMVSVKSAKIEQMEAIIAAHSLTVEAAARSDAARNPFANQPQHQQPRPQEQLRKVVVLVRHIADLIPQNILSPPPQYPQQAVFDKNQAACTSSGAGYAILTSSASPSSENKIPHHQASSSNTVNTTRSVGHKRPRYENSTSSSSNYKISPTIKRIRSRLDDDYQVPTSSQCEEDKNLIMENSKEEVKEERETCDMEASSDEKQHEEGEGDVGNAQHDNNTIEVGDSSDAPAHVGNSAEEWIVTSPQKKETPQILAICSGSETRSSTPHCEVGLQACEEIDADIIAPSNLTLCLPQLSDR